MVRVEDEVVEGRVVERQLVGVKDDGPNAALGCEKREVVGVDTLDTG